MESKITRGENMAAPDGTVGEMTNRGRKARSSEQVVLIRLVDRVNRILETVAACEDGATLTELSRATDMPHPTVYRILRALMSKKWLVQDEITKKYSVGVELFRLGNRYAAQNPLEKIAAPVMRELRDATHQSTHLAVLEGAYSVYVAVLATTSEIQVMSRVGSRKPAYCCATGKALLAFQPEAVVIQAVKESGLQRLTENTITTLDDLLTELARIRARGYALDLGEHNPHICGVGAPIRDSSGKVVASLSVGGPSFELPRARLEELSHKVIEAAQTVSRMLGDTSRGSTRV